MLICMFYEIGGDLMKRIENVFEALKQLCLEQYKENRTIVGVSANTISSLLGIQRTNTSSDLNKLFKEKRIEKVEGKPVLYKVDSIQLRETSLKHKEGLEENGVSIVEGSDNTGDVFEGIIGAKLSLKNSVQQARAAIIYPPNGLHTLLLGETGTGKSMFAETMYKYAKEIGKIKSNSPFVAFNCADYANNPQLLMAQLFGVKKGAYTGAERDRVGLVEKANEGILFLDEIHRLPPEGQEMLFYLIDKGIYRRLGDPNTQYHAKLLIICATTENIESTLLKTFTRRIPMIIKLPSLKDRTIDERYQLVKSFFKIEATSIKSDIHVTSNALKALLLYDCSNNIGQLKSDVKLCCAKAFLENMMRRNKQICVHSEDMPDYVLRGVFKYKEYKEEVDSFINKDLIKFSISGSNGLETEDRKIFNFYEALEEKRRLLEDKGVSEKDIKLIMSLDIDTYLKKYILNIDDENLEELYKVVDKRIVNAVEEFLKYAGENLKRRYSSKILHALSMHLASAIERISSGKEIQNHQLEDMKNQYKKEFNISFELKAKVKKLFNMDLPESEIGFITMFLTMDEEESHEGKVAILVAMHGESAATSIADVANRLLEENYAIGYNMPLDQKPEIALERMIEIVKKINSGKGVVLMVDMGSLVFFGDMIYERTKIPVKTIEMVSTPMVLEGTRKALLNSSLEDVYDSCTKLSPYIGRIYKEEYRFNEGFKNDVILTACVTGQGTALKLKSILEEKIEISKFGIDIIPIEISDRVKFKDNISNLKKQKNVLAVVSAINPQDEELLYVSTSEVFNKEKLIKLKEMLNIIQTINNMEDVIDESVDIDAPKYIKAFKRFYICLLNSNVTVSEDILLGLILHLACVVERIQKGMELIHINAKTRLVEEHLNEYTIVKNAAKSIENDFNINLVKEDYINIMKIVYFL